uniref:Uncharacterized protein n=1 Tax=Acrobeloides nanus TaxID=290746 RepID=A0A914CEE4_9BILA
MLHQIQSIATAKGYCTKASSVRTTISSHMRDLSHVELGQHVELCRTSRPSDFTLLVEDRLLDRHVDSLDTGAIKTSDAEMYTLTHPCNWCMLNSILTTSMIAPNSASSMWAIMAMEV